MENRAHALAAGLFLLVLMLAGVAAVAWFQGDHNTRVAYTVVSRSGVAGLNVKAPVKLRGVEIGKVEAIAFDPADPMQILVTIAVDPAAPVTRGTYAKLGLQGVTGLSFVDLNHDSGGDNTRLPAPARIALRPTLFDQLAASGPGLLAGFAESAQRLNRLLGDDNQVELKRSLAALGRSADEVSRLTAALQPSVRALPALLKRADETLASAGGAARQIDTLAGEARALTLDLRTGMAALDRLGSAAQQIETTAAHLDLALVGNAGPRRRSLVDDVSAASVAVQQGASAIGDRPQSLLFGPAVVPAGPGESGFDRAGAR